MSTDALWPYMVKGLGRGTYGLGLGLGLEGPGLGLGLEGRGLGLGLGLEILALTTSLISGLSAVTYSLTFSGCPSGFGDIQSSGTRTSLDSRHGNPNFRRVIYFRFLSEFYFQSDLYIRDSGGTASPCAGSDYVHRSVKITAKLVTDR